MNGGFQPSGRVVVTGIGGLCPLGTGIDVFWPRMLAGENGIGPVTRMDASEYTTRVAGQVNDFNPEDWVERKEAKRMDLYMVFAIAAARMALEDAKFPEDPEFRQQTGALIGSGIGGLTLLTEQIRKLVEGGPGRVSPFLVPYMIPDMASGIISILHGLKGPNTCVVSACSTGADAVGIAYQTIKRGDAIAMVCGGGEAPVNEISMAGFCSMRAMTHRNDDPAHASRPFDRDRDGFVIAEGSAILVLEDLEVARARGAKIYAEIVGYGATGDAHHITMPDPNGDGARRSMLMALNRAGLEPSAIDYINAHGTSTPYNDKFETLAIKGALGEHAYKVSVSSTKSMVGHTLGAAGALESVICILALRDQKVPPTRNLDNPDPDCDLDYTPHIGKDRKVDYALNNSFGFGGHNVSLVFRHPRLI